MKSFIEKPFSSLNRHLGLMKEAVHHAGILEMARQRVFAASIIFSALFLVIAGRLVDVMLFQTSKRPKVQFVATESEAPVPRADIYDRNGNIVATHLVTASIYANPKVIIDPEIAAKKLAVLFPEIGYKTLFSRLNSGKGFVWLSRHITPKMQKAVNELGIPGVYLQKDFKRAYLYGNLMSHVLGFCNIDSSGLAGVERFYDKSLSSSSTPIRLSMDVRIQHIVRDTLLSAIAEFRAEGGNAMVMDIKSGQMLAMVSLPDFDPHQVKSTTDMSTFNRNTLGVFEPGSTWKIVNTAIALETGHATPKTFYDARFPIKIGKYTITDFSAKNRMLNLTEAFVYSSNIASIKIAQQFGIQHQINFFKKLGVTKATSLEIPEIGAPLIPRNWSEATLMTASYGYGIAVTPLQVVSIIGSIINNGVPVQPTLLYKPELFIQSDENKKTPVVSTKTSQIIREMMRLVATHGSARKANVEGYEVIAKTGTAYQNNGRSYDQKNKNTFCLGAFPFSDPKVLIFVMLNSPKPSKETYNFATAGWNATPTLGKIIERIGPMLGFHPNHEESSLKYVHSWDNKPSFIDTSLSVVVE